MMICVYTFSVSHQADIWLTSFTRQLSNRILKMEFWLLPICQISFMLTLMSSTGQVWYRLFFGEVIAHLINQIFSTLYSAISCCTLIIYINTGFTITFHLVHFVLNTLLWHCSKVLGMLQHCLA